MGAPIISGRIREDGEIPSRPRHCDRFEAKESPPFLHLTTVSITGDGKV